MTVNKKFKKTTIAIASSLLASSLVASIIASCAKTSDGIIKQPLGASYANTYVKAILLDQNDKQYSFDLKVNKDGNLIIDTKALKINNARLKQVIDLNTKQTIYTNSELHLNLGINQVNKVYDQNNELLIEINLAEKPSSINQALVYFVNNKNEEIKEVFDFSSDTKFTINTANLAKGYVYKIKKIVNPLDETQDLVDVLTYTKTLGLISKVSQYDQDGNLEFIVNALRDLSDNVIEAQFINDKQQIKVVKARSDNQNVIISTKDLTKNDTWRLSSVSISNNILFKNSILDEILWKAYEIKTDYNLFPYKNINGQIQVVINLDQNLKNRWVELILEDVETKKETSTRAYTNEKGEVLVTLKPLEENQVLFIKEVRLSDTTKQTKVLNLDKINYMNRFVNSKVNKNPHITINEQGDRKLIIPTKEIIEQDLSNLSVVGIFKNDKQQEVKVYGVVNSKGDVILSSAKLPNNERYRLDRIESLYEIESNNKPKVIIPNDKIPKEIKKEYINKLPSRFTHRDNTLSLNLASGAEENTAIINYLTTLPYQDANEDFNFNILAALFKAKATNQEYVLEANFNNLTKTLEFNTALLPDGLLWTFDRLQLLTKTVDHEDRSSKTKVNVDHLYENISNANEIKIINQIQASQEFNDYDPKGNLVLGLPKSYLPNIENPYLVVVDNFNNKYYLKGILADNQYSFSTASLPNHLIYNPYAIVLESDLDKVVLEKKQFPHQLKLSFSKPGAKIELNNDQEFVVNFSDETLLEKSTKLVLINKANEEIRIDGVVDKNLVAKYQTSSLPSNNVYKIKTIEKDNRPIINLAQTNQSERTIFKPKIGEQGSQLNLLNIKLDNYNNTKAIVRYLNQYNQPIDRVFDVKNKIIEIDKNKFPKDQLLTFDGVYDINSLFADRLISAKDLNTNFTHINKENLQYKVLFKSATSQPIGQNALFASVFVEDKNNISSDLFIVTIKELDTTNPEKSFKVLAKLDKKTKTLNFIIPNLHINKSYSITDIKPVDDKQTHSFELTENVKNHKFSINIKTVDHLNIEKMDFQPSKDGYKLILDLQGELKDQELFAELSELNDLVINQTTSTKKEIKATFDKNQAVIDFNFSSLPKNKTYLITNIFTKKGSQKISLTTNSEYVKPIWFETPSIKLQLELNKTASKLNDKNAKIYFDFADPTNKIKNNSLVKAKVSLVDNNDPNKIIKTSDVFATVFKTTSEQKKGSVEFNFLGSDINQRFVLKDVELVQEESETVDFELKQPISFQSYINAKSVKHRKLNNTTFETIVEFDPEELYPANSNKTVYAVYETINDPNNKQTIISKPTTLVDNKSQIVITTPNVITNRMWKLKEIVIGTRSDARSNLGQRVNIEQQSLLNLETEPVNKFRLSNFRQINNVGSTTILFKLSSTDQILLPNRKAKYLATVSFKDNTTNAVVTKQTEIKWNNSNEFKFDINFGLAADNNAYQLLEIKLNKNPDHLLKPFNNNQILYQEKDGYRFSLTSTIARITEIEEVDQKESLNNIYTDKLQYRVNVDYLEELFNRNLNARLVFTSNNTKNQEVVLSTINRIEDISVKPFIVSSDSNGNKFNNLYANRQLTLKGLFIGENLDNIDFNKDYLFLKFNKSFTTEHRPIVAKSIDVNFETSHNDVLLKVEDADNLITKDDLDNIDVVFEQEKNDQTLIIRTKIKSFKQNGYEKNLIIDANLGYNKKLKLKSIELKKSPTHIFKPLTNLVFNQSPFTVLNRVKVIKTHLEHFGSNLGLTIRLRTNDPRLINNKRLRWSYTEKGTNKRHSFFSFMNVVDDDIEFEETFNQSDIKDLNFDLTHIFIGEETSDAFGNENNLLLKPISKDELLKKINQRYKKEKKLKNN